MACQAQNDIREDPQTPWREQAEARLTDDLLRECGCDEEAGYWDTVRRLILDALEPLIGVPKRRTFDLRAEIEHSALLSPAMIVAMREEELDHQNFCEGSGYDRVFTQAAYQAMRLQKISASLAASAEPTVSHVPIPEAHLKAAERFKSVMTAVPLTDAEKLPDPDYFAEAKARTKRAAERFARACERDEPEPKVCATCQSYQPFDAGSGGHHCAALDVVIVLNPKTFGCSLHELQAPPDEPAATDAK